MSLKSPVLYIPARHSAYGIMERQPTRIRSQAPNGQIIAPLNDAEQNILDTPFDHWPIRKSFNDATCDCCGHIECIND